MKPYASLFVTCLLLTLCATSFAQWSRGITSVEISLDGDEPYAVEAGQEFQVSFSTSIL